MGSWSFKQWYEQNKEEFNKRRKERYWTDAQYRARILERDRESRRKKLLQNKMQSLDALRQSYVLRVSDRVFRPVEAEVNVDGEVKRVALFRPGAVARVLGVSTQTVRLWESKGILPKPAFRSPRGVRLYTLEQVEQVKALLEQKGKVNRDRDVRGSRRVKSKGVTCLVRFANGEVHPVDLYRVGVLAAALNLSAETVRCWEDAGILPETPFRLSTKQHRLYTAPMIQVVKAAFETFPFDRLLHGVSEAKEKFCAAVLEGWEKLGVIGASLA